MVGRYRLIFIIRKSHRCEIDFWSQIKIGSKTVPTRDRNEILFSTETQFDLLARRIYQKPHIILAKRF